MPWRIVIDHNRCIGAAVCAAEAPATFALDPEDKAIAKSPPQSPNEELMWAARACPVLAITLIDEGGERLWPER